jgi:hypothetical protein
METVRLRKIQQPSQVERLLDLLISRGSYLPNDSFQIRHPGEAGGAGVGLLGQQSGDDPLYLRDVAGSLARARFTGAAGESLQRNRRAQGFRIVDYRAGRQLAALR